MKDIFRSEATEGLGLGAAGLALVCSLAIAISAVGQPVLPDLICLLHFASRLPSHMHTGEDGEAGHIVGRIRPGCSIAQPMKGT